MTGDRRRTLVGERLLRPTGLAVDYHKNDRVFWADSKLNVIESANADGSDRVAVTRSGDSSGCALNRPLDVPPTGHPPPRPPRPRHMFNHERIRVGLGKNLNR